MSVTAVNKIRETYSVADGKRSGTRIYRVEVDDLTHDAEDVLDAAGIPSIGTAWKSGDLAKATGKSSAEDQDDQQTYLVTVNYSSSETEIVENPLARAPDYNWSGSEESEPYFRDVDDLPVVNSAGQDFEQLPERLVTRGTLSIARNEATYNDVTAEGYKNTTNSDAVTINGTTYAVGTLNMSTINAQGPNVENDVTFYRVTYNIKKRIDGWLDKFEDRGLDEVSAGKLVPILDKNQEPVAQPYPLDGAGAKKANATDTPATIDRKPYAAVSWAGLGFT